MNQSLIPRYALELSMVIPAALMAVLPVRGYKKITTKFLVLLFAVLISVFIAGGSVLCAMFELPSNAVLFSFLFIFLAAYHFCFELQFIKKLYCFMTSAMLCGFCTMYSVFATAPLELSNTYNVFTVLSGIICLGITFLLAALFSWTLAFKLPELFENHSIDNMWFRLNIIPLVLTIVCIWMIPVSPETVMVGRVRIVSMVVFLLVPIAIWSFMHIQWKVARNMMKNADLQQSYDILKLEKKQYDNMLKAFEESRNLRHDFRQHLLVINDLAQKGDTEKLLEYISPFIETSGMTPKRIFENYALNAVACHYIELAKKQETKILWNINMPQNIPLKESDLCAMMGNLIENSMAAVLELPIKEREIHIAMALKQENLLIISVTNPYDGIIEFDKNGFPKTTDSDHGIGLKSIMNTVKRYKGSMSIETKNGCFDVGILLNC